MTCTCRRIGSAVTRRSNLRLWISELSPGQVFLKLFRECRIVFHLGGDPRSAHLKFQATCQGPAFLFVTPPYAPTRRHCCFVAHDVFSRVQLASPRRSKAQHVRAPSRLALTSNFQRGARNKMIFSTASLREGLSTTSGDLALYEYLELCQHLGHWNFEVAPLLLEAS